MLHGADQGRPDEEWPVSRLRPGDHDANQIAEPVGVEAGRRPAHSYGATWMTPKGTEMFTMYADYATDLIVDVVAIFLLAFIVAFKDIPAD